MTDDEEYDYFLNLFPSKVSTEELKCFCGCNKTYGENCPKDYHSDWCPLNPKYKNFSEDTYPNLNSKL